MQERIDKLEKELKTLEIHNGELQQVAIIATYMIGNKNKKPNA